MASDMARVLVIDDEPDVLLLCRVNLEHAGHQVLLASDGRHGVEVALAERPDAIVLDLMLPDIDGYSVLTTVGDDPNTKHIPVIVLTAKAQREDRIRSWQTGASEYMTKPFSPAVLAAALDQILAMTPKERAEHRGTSLRKLGFDPASKS